jgi:hypothetical protein
LSITSGYRGVKPLHIEHVSVRSLLQTISDRLGQSLHHQQSRGEPLYIEIAQLLSFLVLPVLPDQTGGEIIRGRVRAFEPRRLRFRAGPVLNEFSAGDS